MARCDVKKVFVASLRATRDNLVINFQKNIIVYKLNEKHMLHTLQKGSERSESSEAFLRKKKERTGTIR